MFTVGESRNAGFLGDDSRIQLLMKQIDPRWWQIGSLTALLAYGVAVLRFDVTVARATMILVAALVTQLICSRICDTSFEWKSAAISALSLSLLLRSNSIAWLLLAAFIAIAGKFFIRIDGKHIFNPTNFAITSLMLTTNRVWVSPGQWGSVAFFGFLVMCAGAVVVVRSKRSDVTLAFLLFWSALLIARAIRLGDPLTIPLHRLENGALLIFAFFMISDPKTTPDSRAGRVLFAAIVACGAWFVQFRLFHTNALLWSLVAASPLVPLIDRALRAPRFEWRTSSCFDTLPSSPSLSHSLLRMRTRSAAST